MMARAAVVLALSAVALGGQSSPNDRLRAGLKRLAEIERQTVGSIGKSDTAGMRKARPLYEEKAALAPAMSALLDSVVLGTPWGPAELKTLEREYPGSALLERASAKLAVHEGRTPDAVAAYRKLLRGEPKDLELQMAYARVLEQAGRPAEARLGYARILELSPEDTASYRALVRLQTADSSLGDLLARLDRIAVRHPESRVVAEHRIEILHRLGRTAEAQAAARALKEKP